MDIEGFIIRLARVRTHAGTVRGEFSYSTDHECHIYQGRVFPVEEFETVVPAVLDKYKSYEARAPYPVLIPSRKQYPNLEKARATLRKKRNETR